MGRKINVKYIYKTAWANKQQNLAVYLLPTNTTSIIVVTSVYIATQKVDPEHLSDIRRPPRGNIW